MSEAEVLSSMMRGHESMMTVLTNRHRSLKIIYSLWHNKDLKVRNENHYEKIFSMVVIHFNLFLHFDFTF